MQIALFVVPVITLAGWVIDQPMDLNFRVFDTVLLVMTILIVNLTLADGKSNWLEVRRVVPEEANPHACAHFAQQTARNIAVCTMLGGLRAI